MLLLLVLLLVPVLPVLVLVLLVLLVLPLPRPPVACVVGCVVGCTVFFQGKPNASVLVWPGGGEGEKRGAKKGCVTVGERRTTRSWLSVGPVAAFFPGVSLGLGFVRQRIGVRATRPFFSAIVFGCFFLPLDRDKGRVAIFADRFEMGGGGRGDSGEIRGLGGGGVGWERQFINEPHFLLFCVKDVLRIILDSSHTHTQPAAPMSDR